MGGIFCYTDRPLNITLVRVILILLYFFYGIGSIINVLLVFNNGKERKK